MNRFVIAAVASLAVFGSAYADTCESKAVDKNGKPLAGAAKTASIGKCQKDAQAACEAKALDKNGKPLAGAAKTANVKKCVSDTTGG